MVDASGVEDRFCMTVSWALSHREVTLLSTVSPSTVYCSQTKSDPTVSCLFLSQRQGAMFGRRWTNHMSLEARVTWLMRATSCNE